MKKIISNLKSQKISLIPCSDLVIELDQDKTVGGDFTVEEYYTFSTHDGVFVQDTMSIFTPMSKEAQEEAKKKMMVITSNESINKANYELSKEVLTGLFTLTYTKNNNSRRNVKTLDEIFSMHIGDNISIRFRNNVYQTTVGKIIFNRALPEYYPFVDEYASDKVIKKILSNIIEKNKDDFIETLDRLMRLGFIYATAYPKSIDISKLQISKELEELKVKLSKEKDFQRQSEILSEMEKLMMEHISKNVPSLYIQVQSGASKGKSQVRQLMVSKGVTVDPSGNLLPPIISSISDGYTPREYFNAAAGARAGLISKAIGTASGGYEYRKVIFAVGNVRLNSQNPDCGTKNHLIFKLNNDIYKRLRGRYIFNKDRYEPISEKFIGKIIQLRSPIFCKSFDICRLCYGDLLYQLKSENIGIIAAQEVASLSEKFMKLFHLGGVVQIEGVNIFKEFLNNIDDIYLPILKENFVQEHNYLITKVKCQIRIPKKIYTDKFNISEDHDFIKIPVGYFDLIFKGETLSISMEKEVKFFKYRDNIKREENFLILEYEENTKVLKVEASSIDYNKITMRIDDVMSGKVPFRDVHGLYFSFINTMMPTGGFDSVHLEVILSNALRNKRNPQYPARVKEPYEAIMVNIKKLPSIISWPLGLAFENFGKSIQYGMISQRAPESPIEKILMGVSLTGVKIRGK
mgnify:CR=1 FL=1